MISLNQTVSTSMQTDYSTSWPISNYHLDIFNNDNGKFQKCNYCIIPFNNLAELI